MDHGQAGRLSDLRHVLGAIFLRRQCNRENLRLDQDEGPQSEWSQLQEQIDTGDICDMDRGRSSQD